MSSNDAFTSCLDNNKVFAEKFKEESPDLLNALGSGQSPKILWIGCSDSRVPETTILGCKPGDVFTHRNIANILHAGDINALSVIEYSVGVLGVQHVVVCGHIGCGGVNAALGQDTVGSILNSWLMPIRRLRVTYKKELEALGSPSERAEFLVKANVKEGIKTLKEMAVVTKRLALKDLQIHGVVYDVRTALVTTIDGTEDTEEDLEHRGIFKVQ